MHNSKEFIELIKKGDKNAFQELVEFSKDRIYNTCLALLQNNEDAEDQTQEVFITVFHSIHQFKGDSTLQTWIYRIAVNKCKDFLKKKNAKKRLSFLTSLLKNETVELAVNFEHPGIVLEKKENAKILFEALKELPENQKIAFTLNKIENLSYQEIADTMQVSLSSVESLIFRAKTNMKKIIEKKYPEMKK